MRSAEKHWLLSSAVFRRAKLEQAGEDTAPNKWTDIWYSSSAQDKSPFGHHRKRRKKRSASGTFTCWNIPSMSTMIATRSCQNLVRTPKWKFVRSGPLNSLSSSDLPLYLTEQSKTTRIFPGLVRVVYTVMGDEPCLSHKIRLLLILENSLGEPLCNKLLNEGCVVLK